MENKKTDHLTQLKNRNDSLENLDHLMKLEKEVKEELEQQQSRSRKSSFYSALDTIIDLKDNVEGVNQNFESILEVFLSMATGDFSKRLEVSNRKNLFSLLAVYINKVNEELAENVVKKHILEEALELTPEFAVITDLKGTILYSNSAACHFLNLTKENVSRLIVANIFESKNQFGVENYTGEDIKDARVNLAPYNQSPFPILLSIKKLSDANGSDSYLYTARLA